MLDSHSRTFIESVCVRRLCCAWKQPPVTPSNNTWSTTTVALGYKPPHMLWNKTTAFSKLTWLTAKQCFIHPQPPQNRRFHLTSGGWQFQPPTSSTMKTPPSSLIPDWLLWRKRKRFMKTMVKILALVSRCSNYLIKLWQRHCFLQIVLKYLTYILMIIFNIIFVIILK